MGFLYLVSQSFLQLVLAINSESVYRQGRRKTQMACSQEQIGDPKTSILVQISIALGL